MTEKVLDTSKFLSAEALGITADERSALIEVMLGLECGELKHFRPGSKNGSFNMAYWEYRPTGCGTVCCIGGWMGMKMHPVFFDDRRGYPTNYSMSLLPLFFPNAETDGVQKRQWWYHIEPHHAVGAIRDFLTTGKPNWNNHRP